MYGFVLLGYIELSYRYMFGLLVLGTAVTPPVLSGDYGISLEQLVSITRNHDISVLQQNGGASQIQFYFLLH